MYPNQGRNIDKENDIVADSTPRPSVHATLVKQASLVGSRTPTKQQLNTTKTSALEQGVLRSKTNIQQLPLNPDGDSTPLKKKGNLTRTFSASLESSNNINKNISDPINTKTATSPVSIEPRRRSLNRRGSTKTRLVIHKDEPAISEASENIVKRSKDIKQTTVVTKSGPIESTSTLLSIERAIESQEKVVVGPAETQNKRRALTNDEDAWEIEYCPPPVKEQPHDPEFGFDIDFSAISSVPPNIAYHLRDIDEFDDPGFEVPVIEESIQRPSRPTSPNHEEEEDIAPIPKSEITADGHLNFTWSDDEEDEDQDVHPRGGRRFGIKDLEDDQKTRPPFDGFTFENDASEDSLSEDEFDIFGVDNEIKDGKVIAAAAAATTGSEFNEALGLGDLEDETKVQAPFTDFAFEL
ncbi:hypothetical protein BGZ76_001138 [Entomortierella beljakovae]|nr:hypothetical protein BGZ76_001138 [Entomortierella beljakovae]